MTALVAVMNKQAVALAADSAGTVPVNLPGRDHHKIYAMNKVFALSKSAPIGVMICGQSQYLGFPWESIIKRFRRAGPTRSHATIDDWCSDFRTYLTSLIPLVPDKERDRAVVQRYLDILENVIGGLVRDGVTHDAIAQGELENRLAKRAENMGGYPVVSEVPDAAFDEFEARNKSAVEAEENAIFSGYELKPLELDGPRRAIIVNLLSRQVRDEIADSQIVIAGFGADEWFPTVRSILIDGVANNSLRTWSGAGSKIDHSTIGADIIPYAQADIVWTLLRGMHPKLRDSLDRALNTALTAELPKMISDLLVTHIPDSGNRDSLVGCIGEITSKLSANITEQLTQQSNKYHALPVLASIQHLGKGELAQLAESLITTTSLKYRMAIDAQESVGGPVDVAVVSRDEGFIWIRRKHYFDIGINPSFRDQQAGL